MNKSQKGGIKAAVGSEQKGGTGPQTAVVQQKVKTNQEKKTRRGGKDGASEKSGSNSSGGKFKKWSTSWSE